MIVVDTGVLVVALADDGDDGDAARARLQGEALVGPHLLDLEVVAAWRRLAAAGRLDLRRAELARADLQQLPLRLVPHGPLLDRCWELRDNLTAYDAVYVALAEALDAVLVTTDARVAGAPGPRCRIDVLA